MSKVRVVPMAVVLAIVLPIVLPTVLAAQGSISTPDNQVTALMLWDPKGAAEATTQLVVGGQTLGDSTPLSDYVALYDPETGYWQPLGRGVDGPVRAMAVDPDGDLIVGGDFENAGGVPASRVARWDGERWHALETGLDEERFTGVRALAMHPIGSLFVGGSFATAGSAKVANLARWDGKEWSDVGDGLRGFWARVDSLAILRNCDLVAAGSFEFAGDDHADNLARWDGKAWHTFEIGTSGTVLAVLPWKGDELMIGGRFERAGSELATNVARWDGERWHALGPGVEDPVTCLAQRTNGELLVGNAAAGVSQWDGSAWREIGDLGHGTRALTVLANDMIFAGGDGLSSWRGSGWVPILAEGRD